LQPAAGEKGQQLGFAEELAGVRARADAGVADLQARLAAAAAQDAAARQQRQSLLAQAAACSRAETPSLPLSMHHCNASGSTNTTERALKSPLHVHCRYLHANADSNMHACT
jgi:hypothetical protein